MSRPSTAWRILVPAVLATALLWGAARQNWQVLEQRRAQGISRVDPLEEAPPLVAFTTVALGGFRGLLADWLWLRASHMQQEGRYFELVQLAEWITALEPHFTEVWAFHAWNLAYNISVLFDAPEDRWRWVHNGIRLLRDRGLAYNPGDAALYRELGWMFQHKVGDYLDDAHWHYKREWADAMATLFTGRAPEYELLLATPSTRAAWLQTPGAEDLAQQVRALGLDPFDGRHGAPDALPEEVRRPLADHPAYEGWRQFLRRRRLQQEFKLEPLWMQRVDERYGPLDWRMPQAHAIYWAYRGREYAEGFDLIATDRMIFQSLAEAFRRGGLFIEPQLEVFAPVPNLDLLPRVRHAYEEALQAYPDQDTVRTAHHHFLVEALTLLTAYNRVEPAREVFEDLRARYPEIVGGADFEAFVYQAMTGQIRELTVRSVTALVEGALYQGYFWLAVGDSERAAGFMRMARILHREYMRRQHTPEMRERLGLPPLERMRQHAREQVQALFPQAEAHERLQP